MARGHIRQRANGSYEVFVYAGRDALTGKERRRAGTAHSRREAERLIVDLQGAVNSGRTAGTKVTVAEVIDQWLATADHELTTRRNYERYFQRIIKPALGNVQARKLDVVTLDRFYGELRRRGGKSGQALQGTPSARSTSSCGRPSDSRSSGAGSPPTRPSTRPSPSSSARKFSPPTKEEAQRFLDAAGSSIRTSGPSCGWR
jgi:hypothetical protein